MKSFKEGFPRLRIKKRSVFNINNFFANFKHIQLGYYTNNKS